MKKGILLVNLGTPDSPSKKDVSRYLREFLGDPYVISIPNFFRKILVNLIIVPFRSSKSSAMYAKVWTKEGSPLLYNHLALLEKVQSSATPDLEIEAAMRYRNPSIKSGLQKLKSKGVEELTVIPLFPQYAQSTTETVINEVKSLGLNFQSLRFIQNFYTHPLFIKAFAEKILKHNPETFDKIVFSYHSLPESHLEKLHPGIKSLNCACENGRMPEEKNCYKAQCYQTTRLILEQLKLEKSKAITTFQSRFAKKWIGPFTEDVLMELAGEQKKRVLLVAPSFVADCLETIYELGMEYKTRFENAGGEELVLVKSLNDDDHFVQMILDL